MLICTLQASEMLHFGRKITAFDAQQWGLVSEVYSPEEGNKVWDKIHLLAELPTKVSTAWLHIIL